MEQNITIQVTDNTMNVTNATFGTNNTSNIIDMVATNINNGINNMAGLYSNLLGETVTAQQTLHLLNAQAAFLAIVLPVGPLVFNALGVAWFALALRGCKKAGL